MKTFKRSRLRAVKTGENQPLLFERGQMACAAKRVGLVYCPRCHHNPFYLPGLSRVSRKASIFDLGKALHTHLSRYLGPCWVTQWVFDKLYLVDNDFWACSKIGCSGRMEFPCGRRSMSFMPTVELIEIAVLGGMVRASFPIADEIKTHVDNALIKC